jgi:hypothetical protein
VPAVVPTATVAMPQPRAQEPAARRAPGDGGAAKPGRVADTPRDPADLEIKE